MFEFGKLQGAILTAVDYLVDVRSYIANPYISDLTIQMIQRQTRQSSVGVAWQDTPNGVSFGVITNVTPATNTVTVQTHFDYHPGDNISAVVNGIHVLFTIQNINGNILTLDSTTGLAVNQTVTFIAASLPEFGDVKHRTVKWGRDFLFQMQTKMNQQGISHFRQNQLHEFIQTPIVNRRLQLMDELNLLISNHLQIIDNDLWNKFIPSVFNNPQQGLPNTTASIRAAAVPSPSEILTLIRKMVDRARMVGFNFGDTDLYVPNSWDNIMQDNKMIVPFDSQSIENGVIGGKVRRLITNNVTLKWIPSLHLDQTQQCYMVNTDTWRFVTTLDGMLRPVNLPSGGDYACIGMASSFAPHCKGLATAIRGVLTTDGNVPDYPQNAAFRQYAGDNGDYYQAVNAADRGNHQDSANDEAINEIDRLIKEKRAEIDAEKAAITGTSDADNQAREGLERKYTQYVAEQNKILELLKNPVQSKANSKGKVKK